AVGQVGEGEMPVVVARRGTHIARVGWRGFAGGTLAHGFHRRDRVLHRTVEPQRARRGERRLRRERHRTTGAGEGARGLGAIGHAAAEAVRALLARPREVAGVVVIGGAGRRGTMVRQRRRGDTLGFAGGKRQEGANGEEREDLFHGEGGFTAFRG